MTKITQCLVPAKSRATESIRRLGHHDDDGGIRGEKLVDAAHVVVMVMRP